ncbi:MAG TPA: DUF3159 domain-containing protein [Humibacter sp.]|nr:DUF3159 domain-containing protein [Humibacter sp.]
MSNPSQPSESANDESRPDDSRPDEPRPADGAPRPAGDDGRAPDTIGASIAAAAKRSGLAPVAEQQQLDGRALLGAMGGIRGLAETILPGLVFLIVYTFGQNVPISLGASVGVAVIFTMIRVATRSQVTQAVAGLIGVGASAILALITGKGTDNFVLGLVLDGVYGAAMLISVLVAWPLLGLAAGYLMGDGLAWRRDRGRFRAMQVLTLCWFALFAARLLVQLPLYFAGDVAALAITKLIMGVPLYAPLLLLSWLMVRASFTRS